MTQVVLSALLIASSLFLVPAFVTVDASAEDRGPILNEAHVEEITSDEPSKLDELVDNAREQKRKNDYAPLSQEKLTVDVDMASIQSKNRYLVTAPPSVCDTATSDVKYMFDCTSTVAPIAVLRL